VTISTHVLDAVAGTPAAGLGVTLDRRDGDAWSAVARAVTDADGRVADLGPASMAGTYRLTFDTGSYLTKTFYPEVVVVFSVRDAAGHHHVPLLLSPYSYSTYRGS
jgi:5-hydroxyisourate hydrolase